MHLYKIWGQHFYNAVTHLNTFLTHMLKYIQLRWNIDKLLIARNFRVQFSDVKKAPWHRKITATQLPVQQSVRLLFVVKPTKHLV